MSWHHASAKNEHLGILENGEQHIVVLFVYCLLVKLYYLSKFENILQEIFSRSKDSANGRAIFILLSM